jgi:hypothetical protein
LAGGILSEAALRAAQARAQAKYTIPALFDIEKVADGVYAAIARPTAFINCNAAIFEGASGILVVDTHGSATAAVSLVSQLRREITQKPVRYIVNTHYHGDHVQGTPTYKRIAPQADVVSSEATRKKLAEDNGRGLQRAVETAQTTLESHRKKAAGAKSAAEKAYWQKMADETGAFIGEMKLYQPELPNVTFSDNLVIHDKAHVCTLPSAAGGTQTAISSCTVRRRRFSPPATSFIVSRRTSWTAIRKNGLRRWTACPVSSSTA